MDIILIAGLWLDASAWDNVIPRLRAFGHRPVAVELPGQGDRRNATLEDQVDAVLAAVDQTKGPALVVGHSAASTLAWIAADRRPEKVAKVAMVGGMPTTEGSHYAPFFEVVDGVMAFPGWEHFTGPDSADLDDAAQARFEASSHPVPEGVTHAVVTYTSPQRKRVPVVLVCPEYDVEDARQWFEAGEMPELEDVEDLDFVDIGSGHWPMLSRPDALSRVLNDLTIE